jgi:alkanesulfonate monooxygenase SsuD/methylene tetrahydromethanopterin reductase-like flavin-dependent oxidoreductase (luciferase family)
MGLKRLDALEAYSTLASLAMITKKVRLGTSVTNIQTRHPAVLAQTISTLDHISNGRVTTAIGSGEAMSIVPFGIPWNKPVSRMEEAIRVMIKLWTEKSIDFNGEFFKLKGAFINPKPIQTPYPPLWIAANSPRTMKITAKLADGWLPLFRTNYENDLQTILTIRKQVRKSTPLDRGILLYSVIAKDDESAQRILELPAKVFALFDVNRLKQYGLTIPHTFSLQKFAYSQKNLPQIIEYAQKHVPFEIIEDQYLWGSPTHCIEQLEKWIKLGVNYFVIVAFVSEKHREAQYKYWGNQILPYMREQYTIAH